MDPTGQVAELAQIWIFKFDIDFGPRDLVSSLPDVDEGGMKGLYALQIPPLSYSLSGLIT